MGATTPERLPVEVLPQPETTTFVVSVRVASAEDHIDDRCVLEVFLNLQNHPQHVFVSVSRTVERWSTYITCDDSVRVPQHAQVRYSSAMFDVQAGPVSLAICSLRGIQN